MKHFFVTTIEAEPLWKKFEKENGTVSLTEYGDLRKALQALIEIVERPGYLYVPRETME